MWSPFFSWKYGIRLPGHPGWYWGLRRLVYICLGGLGARGFAAAQHCRNQHADHDRSQYQERQRYPLGELQP